MLFLRPKPTKFPKYISQIEPVTSAILLKIKPDGARLLEIKKIEFKIKPITDNIVIEVKFLV